MTMPHFNQLRHKLVLLNPGFAAALICLLFSTILCFFYFDFTDEGFALNLISCPHCFDGNITRFSYFISPIYSAVANNLILLRIFALVIVFISSCFLLIISVCRFKVPSESVIPSSFHFQRALCLTPLGLLIFWPSFTPGYNLTNFLGFVWLSSAILFLDLSKLYKQSRLRACIACLIIVIPLDVIAFSRLTSYLLVLCLLCFITISSKCASLRRLCALSLVLSLISYLSLLIFSQGGFSAAYTDFRLASSIVSHWNYFGQDYSFASMLRRLFPVYLNLLAFFSLSSIFLFVFSNEFASVFRLFPPRFSVANRYQLRLIAFFFLVIAGLLLFQFFRVQRPAMNEVWSQFVMPCILLVPLVISFGLLLSLRCKDNLEIPLFAPPYRLPASFFPAVLFLFPFCFAFGSSNNFYSQAALASVIAYAGLNYCVCGNAAVFGPRSGRILRPLLAPFLPGLIVFVGLVVNFCFFPFANQLPLCMQTTLASVNQTKLLVSRPKANFIEAFRAASKAQGFEPGTGILDLSGNLPGLVYALSGRAIGWPWILGYLPGSTESTIEILRTVEPADLYSAWVLTSSNPTMIDVGQVTGKFGLELSQKYSRVITLKSPQGIGVVTLYRPNSS